ncbi:cyclodeaminase/cyclohydrolase family protein [Clostridia bacterium]|nr:cyclodeaminase/cyclohydrolase family protein [Clostridia bacterium]
MLAKMSIEHYLEQTAAKNPLLPASGSSLALSAALAAALTEFTANTTLGQKGYEEVEASMMQIIQTSKEYRQRFLQYMDEDAKAYTALLAAYKMPTSSDEQIATRNQCISEQTKQAALVPLQLAQDTMSLVEQMKIVLEDGNQKASGDAITALYLSEAVIKSSIGNVKINLNLLNDADFTKKIHESLQILEEQLEDF